VPKCSAELEIFRPIDANPLVVPGVHEPELNLTSPRERRERQEITAIDFGTVGSEGVDLTFGIRPPNEAVPIPSVGTAPDDDDVAVPPSPFALDANEAIDQAEDEVAAPAFGDGRVNVNVELQCGSRDRKLGDRAFSVG
jgi:hypothetical protein